MKSDAPVLVIDDDVLILELIHDTLEDEGYAVATARDGAEALRVLAGVRPALILLDMRMPGMNGWEFSEAYRALPGNHVPIIVVTAGQDAQERAGDIHADAVIGKPFDLEDLIALVARYVGKGIGVAGVPLP